MEQAEIGLIGLAVMGQNLARNIANKGYEVAVYNRTTETMREFIAEFSDESLHGTKTIKEFVKTIKRPRKIIIMVKAGAPIDSVIRELLPHLDPKDIIIDCGNSNFLDTKRRYAQLKEQKINFLGCGVSGGEEGALNGPSMMPGGSKTAWKKVEKILTKAAAKDFKGAPCITYIGADGAGHYVKMVHNGIEYGVMQMIAEAYEMLRTIYKLPAPKIAEIFKKFNRGKLKSYLFEIAVEVLSQKDEFQKGYLIDHILDKAGQKGTGKWTAIDALDRGVALSSISEAVFARVTSSNKELRKKLAKSYKQPTRKQPLPLDTFINQLNKALYAGMISSYAQGYDLIQTAAREEGWEIDLAEVSRIWEGGCIIRADLLNFLHKAYLTGKRDRHLFEIKSVTNELQKNIPSLRKINAITAENAISSPALHTAQSYFEAMTQENSSANMIQGLRDYFGAHTYERIDKKGIFHTNWI